MLFRTVRFAPLLGCFLGCAPIVSAPPPSTPVSQTASTNAHKTPTLPSSARETFDPDLSALPPDAGAKYQAQRFEIRFAGAKLSPTFVRAHLTTQEADFRKAYRQLVHTSELDVIARQRAKRANPKTLAIASGMTILGVGSLVVLGLPQSGCSNNAASCGKGAVSAALIAGAGLYTLGCEAVKGVNCLLDGWLGGQWLNRQEMESSVAEYNRALVRSLLPSTQSPSAPALPEPHGPTRVTPTQSL
jgi:hypothetical protein